MLNAAGVEHQVLNARQIATEAEIVPKRGRRAELLSRPTWPAVAPIFAWAQA